MMHCGFDSNKWAGFRYRTSSSGGEQSLPSDVPEFERNSGSTMSQVVVLVVEDDAMIRMDVVSTIEDAGYAVIEAETADEAILLLEARVDISVVFTDIEMPGSMNGLRLAFAVRDRWPPIAIIIASGRIRPQPDEMPSNVAFLRKPYSEASVISAVRAAC